MSTPPTYRHTRAWIYVIAGALIAIAGVVITITSFEKGVEADGNTYIIAFGPIVAGIALAMRGVSDLAGYRAFVAWRYLLVPHPKVTRTGKIILGVSVFAVVVLRTLAGSFMGSFAMLVVSPLSSPLALLLAISVAVNIGAVFWFVIRHSKPAMFGFLAGVVIALGSFGVSFLIARNQLPFVTLSPETQLDLLQGFGIAMLGGWVIVGLCAFFGSLRAFFTFFTTVPIGGVWIGTSALVMVLAVMSGFETDLREKILGSNAHIQVTREDGDFVEWREVKG